MARWQNDEMLDQALEWIMENATYISVCDSNGPTTYTEATSTYMLAATNGLTSANFTQAAGDTSGRKITTDSFTGLTLSSTGNAYHIAIVDTANTTLLYVTTCSSQGLLSGNTVSIPGFDIEILDSAAPA